LKLSHRVANLVETNSDNYGEEG